MKTRLTPLILAAGLGLAACAPMGGRPSQEGPPPGEGHGPQALNVVADLQTRLQTTAGALQLSPTQQVLWEQYQEKVGRLMADQLKPPSYSARSDALRQIGQRVDLVRNRLAALEEIQDSAARLYAALDEGQKRTADRLLPATVPEIFTGMVGGGGVEHRPERPEGRGGRGGGMGGPGGGGMGGGFGRP